MCCASSRPRTARTRHCEYLASASSISLHGHVLSSSLEGVQEGGGYFCSPWAWHSGAQLSTAPLPPYLRPLCCQQGGEPVGDGLGESPAYRSLTQHRNQGHTLLRRPHVTGVTVPINVSASPASACSLRLGHPQDRPLRGLAVWPPRALTPSSILVAPLLASHFRLL